LGKKAPKAPTPPDPYKTAAAQTEMNRETAIANANLNRINQYTPEGSLEFNQIGVNPDGTPKYESRQAYSPEQQRLYESQNAVSNALSDLSLSNVGRVNDAQSKPFDYSGMTPLQTGIATGELNMGYDPGGQVRQTYDRGGQIQQGYDTGGNIQRQIGDAGNIQDTYGSGGDIARGYASGGDVQKGLDFSKLQGIPGIGDFGAEAQRVQDAVYNQATSRLDPRYEQEQRALGAQLAGKGVSENSEAYRRAMDQFARNKTDAYNQATYSGIQAGGQEQSRLFGLAMGARQQGAAETQTAGQFANQAQQQAEAQSAARAGFGNTAQAQAEAQSAARAAFGNEAQGQRFGQEAQRGAFANAAQGQQYGQNQALAEFANQAQGQQYEQNAQEAQFANAGQGQQNAQNAAQAAFGNTAQGQAYEQAANNAAFNNNARQQQIQEATYLRNLPLNEISALMGASGGVQAPQFANFANVDVANTDYAGLVQNQFANQQAQYNQKLQQQQAGLGSIFGLAGSLGGAAMMSDRRLKHSFKAIGELASGIKTYVFSYLGQTARQFGVMADEVFKVSPSAVIIRPDGYLMVDYRKVW
jgi:hypothetical protein